jgi:hypothetical protein
MALLSVGLAERIGAHLALAAFSLMEIRLDQGQLMVARRADGNMEAVELPRGQRNTDSLDTRRPQTGEISADGALAAVRDVSGVQSCFAVSDAGELVAGDLTPPLDDVSMETLSPLLLRLCAVFPHRDEQLLCTLHFGGHLLFIRALQHGVLCVLASAWISLPAARMAMGVVARQWTLLTNANSGHQPEPESLVPLARPARALDPRWKRLAGGAVAAVLIVGGAAAGRLAFRPSAPPPPAPPIAHPRIEIQGQQARPVEPTLQPLGSAVEVFEPPVVIEPTPTLQPPPAPAHRRRAIARRVPPPAPVEAQPPPRTEGPARQPARGPASRPIDDANPYLRDVR